MDRVRGILPVLNRFDSGSDNNPIYSELTGDEGSSICPSMSLKDRVIGFGVTTAIGLLLSVAGTINIWFTNYVGEYLQKITKKNFSRIFNGFSKKKITYFLKDLVRFTQWEQ